MSEKNTGKQKNKGALILVIGCAISLVFIMSAFAFNMGFDDHGIWGIGPEENMDQSESIDANSSTGIDSNMSEENNQVKELLKNLSELCKTEDVWPSPRHQIPLEKKIIDKGASAVPQLVEALKDEKNSSNYHAFAAQMLGDINDPSANEALQDKRIEQAAEEVLINRRGYSSFDINDSYMKQQAMFGMNIPQGEKVKQAGGDVCLGGN